MSDKLIIQSIGEHPHDRFIPYMRLQEPIHRAYAERCGADYLYWKGVKDRRCNPTWNRIVMMLDAFAQGYRKIMWMDADVLVVRPEVDVFAETSEAPLLMTRVFSACTSMPWKTTYDEPLRAAGLCGMYRVHPAEHTDVCTYAIDHEGEHGNDTAAWTYPQWDVYNDGILIANDSDHARAALDFAWQHRVAPFEPWHVPGMPELDWLLDYVYDHPDAVEQLDDKFNWMGYPHTCPRDEAVIMAWHGQKAHERWEMFKSTYDEFYG